MPLQGVIVITPIKFNNYKLERFLYFQVHLVLLALLDKRDQPERVERVVFKVLRVHKDHRVLRELLDWQEQLEIKE
jgi:hypothetical protein